MIKNNLLVLSLDNGFAKHTKQKLAEMLDLFFVDVDDILQYNMIDDNMLETCGKEYFEKEQKKVLLGLLDYENSLVSGKINHFFKDDLLRLFQEKFLIVYLRFSKQMLEDFQKDEEFCNNLQNTKNLIAYKDEDEILSQFANVVVDMTANESDDIEKIKSCLLEFLEEK